MALQKGINSYVTVAEADAYLTNRLYADEWSNAAITLKEKALITATRLLDSLSWTGTAIDEKQPLAFPRNAEYFDPRVGSFVLLTEETPLVIENATCELAVHLLQNDVVSSPSTVESIEVSGIVLNTIRNSPTIPANIKRLIRPLLVNGGGNPWWRAN